MDMQYKVAGYVKLAKKWENNRESAIQYHRDYYRKKFGQNAEMTLVDTYIDITGQKQIIKRSEMIRLLKDCREGRVNCIAAQTKGYLAANGKELCFLLKFLFDLPMQIEIITEDVTYRMDTIQNIENQRVELKKMADEYALLDIEAYQMWKEKVLQRIRDME